MLDITIVALGKIKEKYWQQALDEYLKRLRPYCKLAIHEIPEVKFASIREKDRVLAKEAETIEMNIPEHHCVITLDQRGRHFTSEQFASKLSEWSMFGKKITFIIGGPLGLHPRILSLARASVSLSTLTFTHQMARVLLLEQIYRAVTIQNRLNYHY